MDNKLFIYMDESGLINKNEECAVYGGLWFHSVKDRNDFSRKYKAINNEIKCKYCDKYKGNNLCDNVCPEIKNFNIKPSDRRRLFKLIKSHYGRYAIIINNKKIYANILGSKESRGRFKDYAIKLMIKDICKYEIKKGNISKDKHLILNLDFDQAPAVSNGCYDLKGGIIEELVHGINNFNYGIFYPPILKEVTCNIRDWDSRKNVCVQASDILVGEIRKKYINNNKTYIYNNLIIVRFEPNKKSPY